MDARLQCVNCSKVIASFGGISDACLAMRSPELALGLKEGDAHVVRNAGGRA